MKTLLLLCSLLLSFQAFSQTQPQIDLQLTFEAEPPMPWVVEQEGEVRLRVTNLSTTLSAQAQIGPVSPKRGRFRYLAGLPAYLL